MKNSLTKCIKFLDKRYGSHKHGVKASSVASGIEVCQTEQCLVLEVGKLVSGHVGRQVEVARRVNKDDRKGGMERGERRLGKGRGGGREGGRKGGEGGRREGGEGD